MADKLDTVAALVAANAGISLLDLLRKPAPALAASEFPPEVLDLLRAMGATMLDTQAQLSEILAALRQMSLNVQGYPPNADFALSGRVSLTVALTPDRLPQILIPEGFQILVKSWPFNPAAGLILTSKSSGEAKNLDAAWPLIPNESIPYAIKNAQEIWVAATVVPAWVNWTVEQRR